MNDTPLQQRPANAQELIEVVQSAQNTRSSLQVVGGGTKQCVGFPGRVTSLVSMTRFDQVIDYDPAELVMTVGAGVRLSVIEALLAEHRQMLAFEPADFAATVGGVIGASTIGGIVAAGLAGSRRLSAGNVRDHVLGFSAVSGRGEQFVAGGRVVKNVTGYDLPKLTCGSWGQLFIMTQLTLKVLPRPRETLTLDVRGLDDERAFTVMTRAVRSQCEIAAAAYLPAGAIDADSHTLLRLEGFGPSVAARAAAAKDLTGGSAIDSLPAPASTAMWSSIPQKFATASTPDDALWRICIPSTAGVLLCARLRQLGARFYADWAGGLLVSLIPSHVSATQVRVLAENAGGHATLLDAPLGYRASASAQHPEQLMVAALAQRVKLAFDPLGIFDPQRFAA